MSARDLQRHDGTETLLLPGRDPMSRVAGQTGIKHTVNPRLRLQPLGQPASIASMMVQTRAQCPQST